MGWMVRYGEAKVSLQDPAAGVKREMHEFVFGGCQQTAAALLVRTKGVTFG